MATPATTKINNTIHEVEISPPVMRLMIACIPSGNDSVTNPRKSAK